MRCTAIASRLVRRVCLYILIMDTLLCRSCPTILDQRLAGRAVGSEQAIWKEEKRVDRWKLPSEPSNARRRILCQDAISGLWAACRTPSLFVTRLGQDINHDGTHTIIHKPLTITLAALLFGSLGTVSDPELPLTTRLNMRFGDFAKYQLPVAWVVANRVQLAHQLGACCLFSSAVLLQER